MNTIPFFELLLALFGEIPPAEVYYNIKKRSHCIKGDPPMISFNFPKKDVQNYMSLYIHEYTHAQCFNLYPDALPTRMKAEQAAEAVTMIASLAFPSQHWKISNRHPFFLLAPAVFVGEIITKPVREQVDEVLEHFYNAK